MAKAAAEQVKGCRACQVKRRLSKKYQEALGAAEAESGGNGGGARKALLEELYQASRSGRTCSLGCTPLHVVICARGADQPLFPSTSWELWSATPLL